MNISNNEISLLMINPRIVLEEDGVLPNQSNNRNTTILGMIWECGGAPTQLRRTLGRHKADKGPP